MQLASVLGERETQMVILRKLVAHSQVDVNLAPLARGASFDETQLATSYSAPQGLTLPPSPSSVSSPRASFDSIQPRSSIDGSADKEDTPTPPLILAVLAGFPAVVSVILSHPEVHVNLPRKGDGSTALILACGGGLTVSAQSYSFGASSSPLSLAALSEETTLALVKSLLSHPNIDINAANAKGETPFYLACKAGHLGVVRELLKFRKSVSSSSSPAEAANDDDNDKVNVNKATTTGATPFFEACKQGNLALVELLMKEVPEIDVNQPLQSGRTPFHVACEKGCVEVVKYLLQYAAAASAEEDGGKTLAAGGAKKVLVNQGDENGKTPFHTCCAGDQANLVDLLLARDEIDPNKPKTDGSTPLFTVAQEGVLAMVKLLLKSPRVKIDQANVHGVTPLFAACTRGWTEAVDLLVRQPGVNADHIREDGCTPIWVATHKGHTAIVKLLLGSSQKIDVHRRWVTDKTVLEQARNLGREEIIKLLTEYDRQQDL